MALDEESMKNKGRKHYQGRGGAQAGGALYGLGVIGALVYYLSTAASFWLGLFGIFKAIFWPAFVVFELMKYLHM